MDKNNILDPTDETSGFNIARSTNLRHQTINTTDLSIEESAIRVLDVITSQQRPQTAPARAREEMALAGHAHPAPERGVHSLLYFSP